MIVERHMKQARRMDNGEMVTGFYIKIDGKEYINLKPYIKTVCISCLNGESVGIGDFYEVDPATVEDVAVKPIPHEKSYDENGEIIRAFCPNCGLNIRLHGEYCYMCGQRLER